jgi:hypothetical protein
MWFCISNKMRLKKETKITAMFRNTPQKPAASHSNCHPITTPLLNIFLPTSYCALHALMLSRRMFLFEEDVTEVAGDAAAKSGKN